MLFKNIVIGKMEKKDVDKALRLMEEVIIDNFRLAGLDPAKFGKQINEEVKKQKDRLTNLPYCNECSFLVTKLGKNIVGTIGYGPVEPPVIMALKRLGWKGKSIVEIISLYVKPELQRKGIGSLLFDQIILLIKKRGFQYISLRTGYAKGQNFWSKKLGKPEVILEKYIDGVVDSWVWVKKLSEI